MEVESMDDEELCSKMYGVCTYFGNCFGVWYDERSLTSVDCPEYDEWKKEQEKVICVTCEEEVEKKEDEEENEKRFWKWRHSGGSGLPPMECYCEEDEQEKVICVTCKRDFTDEVDGRSSFEDMDEIICMECHEEAEEEYPKKEYDDQGVEVWQCKVCDGWVEWDISCNCEDDEDEVEEMDINTRMGLMMIAKSIVDERAQ